MYYLIGNKPRKEPKQVIFSDGIRPGGDLTDLTEPADVIPAYRRIGRKRVEKALSGKSDFILLYCSDYYCIFLLDIFERLLQFGIF